LAALTALTTANTNRDDTTGIFGTVEQWKTGIIPIKDDDMFYWVFESRSDTLNDPLVMWLTGGPGCASQIALFYENGPYKFPTDIT